MKKHTALIAGATGLVGRELVRQLLASDYYSTVTVVARKSLNVQDKRLKMVIVEDFDKLSSFSTEMNAQDYYCLLGTTRKKAGSRAMFEKIDLEYPKKLAQIAGNAPDFRQFLVVTAAGSNANSPLFYNRVKGSLEEDLKSMDLPSLKIFRPSLLLGHREEFRLGEKLAAGFSNFLSFFIVGRKRGLFSIRASDVAKAMFIVAQKAEPREQVLGSGEMYRLAKSQTA